MAVSRKILNVLALSAVTTFIAGLSLIDNPAVASGGTCDYWVGGCKGVDVETYINPAATDAASCAATCGGYMGCSNTNPMHPYNCMWSDAPY